MLERAKRGLNRVIASIFRQIVKALVYPLPEAYALDPGYIEARLHEENYTPFYRALLLLLNIFMLWIACLRCWISALTYRLNPQWPTLQISRMYGPDVSEQIEQKFLDDHFKLSLATMRSLSPFLLAVTLLSSGLDIWCLPETWLIAWRIRGGVSLFLVAAILFSYRFEDKYQQFHQWIQSASILTASAGLIWIIAQSHITELGHDAYIANLMLFILLTATLSGLRTKSVLWTCLLLMLGYGIIATRSPLLIEAAFNQQLLRLINDAWFIAGSSFLAIAATLWEEQSVRTSFMIRYVLLHTYKQFVQCFDKGDASLLQAAISRLQYNLPALKRFLETSYPAGNVPFLPDAIPALPQSRTTTSASFFLPAVANNKVEPDEIRSDETASSQSQPINQDPTSQTEFSTCGGVIYNFIYDFRVSAKVWLNQKYQQLRRKIATEESYFDTEKSPLVRTLFEVDYFYASIRTIRISLFLGVIVYCLFGVLDWTVLPETRWFALRLRVVGAIIPIVILIASYQEKFFLKAFSWLIGMGIFYEGFSIVLMIIFSHPDELGFKTYYLGLFNTFVFLFVFCKLRFPTATVVSGLTAISYGITAISFQKIYAIDAGWALLLNNWIFLLGSGLAGAIALKLRERYACDEFFVRYLLLEKNKEILAFQEQKNISPQELWTLFTTLRHSPQELKQLLERILDLEPR